MQRRARAASTPAETALRESEERNRALLDAIPDLMFLLDTRGVYLDYHAADPRTLLLPPEHFLGRHMSEVLPAELAEQFTRCFDAVLRTGEARVVEYALPMGNETRSYEARIVRSGREKILSVVRDTTDHKRAEEAQRTLSHVSRLATIGELTAMIAHEVNQPLGAISSNADAAEMLLETPDPPLGEVRRILADVRDDAMRASETIRRIRALVRRGEPKTVPLDLNRTIAHVVQLIHADATRRRIEIDTLLAADLPAVHGDEVYLQQVLLNLVLNGMEAMADSSAEARKLMVRTARNEDGDVEISVSDAGSGIPPERLPRLFDSFFTTKRDGMGLGLSIARSIVEAHGGRIAAENNKDRGATLRFTLPARPPP